MFRKSFALLIVCLALGGGTALALGPQSAPQIQLMTSNEMASVNGGLFSSCSDYQNFCLENCTKMGPTSSKYRYGNWFTKCTTSLGSCDNNIQVKCTLRTYYTTNDCSGTFTNTTVFDMGCLGQVPPVSGGS